jgi:DNA-binding CsgD family transcriptional regulator
LVHGIVCGTVVSPEELEDLFVGRADGLARLLSCADDAAKGAARVVWIEGEAGSGKTALLRRALRSLPPTFTVLRAEAEEITQEIPFSVISQLVSLSSAEPFGAGLELLQAISELEGQGPVAVAIEDLHWADPASRRALLTAARRLSEDQVVMFVTTRPGAVADDGWERFRADPARCQQVVVEALDPDEVAELARLSGVVLNQVEVVRLHAHTGGHPLYVRTLLTELEPARLAGPEGTLPAPRSLALSTVARLAELPGEARQLAAALAVLNRRVPLLVAGRVAGLEQPTAALEPLLTTTFVTWWPFDPSTPVSVSHPLYRAAIYDNLSPTLRQQLHRAAADASEPRAALAHLAAAADGPDDGLADQLEQQARLEAQRRARGLAATQLMWASDLSLDQRAADRRVIDAAALLLEDGQTVRAARLRDRLERCSDSPRRSLVLGRLAWVKGDAAEAERLGLEAIAAVRGAGDDDEVAALAPALLGAIYSILGRGEEGIALAREALAYRSESPEVDTQAWIALSFGEASRRGAPAGLARLAERLPQPAEDVPLGDTELLVMRGTLHLCAGRTTPAIADLRAVAKRGHEAPIGDLPRAHMHLAQLLFDSGAWEEAVVHAHVALSLAAEERWAWIEAPAHGTLGALSAARGDWGQAAEHVTQALEAAGSLGHAEGIVAAQSAQAALARARGEPRLAMEALLPLLEYGDGPEPVMLAGVEWWPTLVAVTIDAGELEAAAGYLQRLEVAATHRGLDLGPRIVGLRARLATARGAVAEATQLFTEALDRWSSDDPLLERTLLQHVFGQLLLRQGDRRGALAQLHPALEALSRLGAEPYCVLVQSDLQLAGSKAAPRRERSALSLSDRERDVATLVATGMTNREVAAQLYVTEKAVEYHLRNVFDKLGIRSRRQLQGTSLATPSAR